MTETMTDLDALLEAVVAAPDDLAPRGILADYLLERDDPRHDTVRRAPDAQRAMVEFPDIAGRLARQARWHGLMLYDSQGHGPRVFYLHGEPVDEWLRVAARLTLPVGGASIRRMYVSTEGGAVRMRMRYGTQILWDTTHGPHSYYDTPISPEWILSGPLDMILSGTGRLSLSIPIFPLN